MEVDSLFRVVAVGGQIGAEAVAFARCAEHYHGFGVGFIDGIDEASVVGGEGAVLGVVYIVVDGAYGGGVSPVVDTVLYGVDRKSVLGKECRSRWSPYH